MATSSHQSRAVGVGERVHGEDDIRYARGRRSHLLADERPAGFGPALAMTITHVGGRQMSGGRKEHRGDALGLDADHNGQQINGSSPELSEHRPVGESQSRCVSASPWYAVFFAPTHVGLRP